MKKFVFFAFLALGLLCSYESDARNPPNGVQNYIKNGHLYVWYKDRYLDMGAYNPGP